MKIATKLNGIALATAAAALFMVAPMTFADDATAVGHCVGSNSCKGHGSCKGANNACKGQNSCKGKGFEEKTKTECDQAGGKFEPAK